MDRHSIVLRAAKPTFEEGLAFARYVDEAAEGFFRFKSAETLGGPSFELCRIGFRGQGDRKTPGHVILREQCIKPLPSSHSTGGKGNPLTLEPDEPIDLDDKPLIAKLREAVRKQGVGIAILGIDDEQLAPRPVLPSQPEVAAQ